MKPQDDASGEQVFATFAKLFLNATSAVRNSSCSKLLDLCPSFFFYFIKVVLPASLRRADSAPDFFSWFFFFFFPPVRIKGG